MASDKNLEHSVARLMRLSKETIITWEIEGLWQRGGIALVHSLEEEFKSVFSYQIAESVASGTPLLRTWTVPEPRRTAVFETEMDDLEVGRRLGIMYPQGDFPENLIVSNNELLTEFRRAGAMSARMNILDKWLEANQVEVLIWDTINSTIATGDPNSERTASQFFDMLRLLPPSSVLLVRHDGKPSRDSQLRDSNQLVRGSNRYVEDASLVLHLKRQDKAQHKVMFTVGKLRNGSKPDPLELWFDAGTFRMTPLPPVIALLEAGPLERQDLLGEGLRRFNLKPRALDQQRKDFKGFLRDSQDGHRRVISLDHTAQPEPESNEARWWPLVKFPKTPDREMQPCISIHTIPQIQSLPSPELD